MLNCEQLSSPISKKDFFIDFLQEFLHNHMKITYIMDHEREEYDLGLLFFHIDFTPWPA